MKNLLKTFTLALSLAGSMQLCAMFKLQGADEIGRNAGREAASTIDITVEKSLRGYIKDGQEYDGAFDVAERVAERLVNAIAGQPNQTQPNIEEKHAQPGIAAPQILAQAPQYPAKPLAHGISEVGKQISDGLKNHKLDFYVKINPEDIVRSTGGCLICLGTAGCIFVPCSLWATLTNCTACSGGAVALINPTGFSNALRQAPGLPQKAMNWAEDHYPLGLLSYCGLDGLKLA